MMTITEGRVERSRKRKERRWHRLSNTYKIVITLFLGVGLLFIFSIFNLYEGTKKWSSSRSHIEMANIDPEYVSDYPNVDTDLFVKMSDSVNSILKSIETNQKAPDNLGVILQDARDFLSKYSIENGHLYDSVAHLELYANYYDLLKIAYSEPDSKKLKDIYISLSNEVLAHNRESDKYMVENLNGIIAKYDQFNQFVNNELPKYGEVKGDNYEINPEIQDFSHLLDTATELKDFPVISSFIDIVNKQKDDIVKNNKSYVEKMSYDKFKDAASKLNGIYVQVSSVKTVEDVIKNGWVVNGRHKNTDKVLEIRYNGSRIDSHDWVRIDLKPEVILENMTTEVQQNETTQSSQTTTPQSTTTDSSTTSSSTTTTQPIAPVETVPNSSGSQSHP